MPIMSRYVLVEIDDASPPIREQYEAFLRASGGFEVPNWLKCFGHSASLAGAYRLFLRGVLQDGELPYILKELVIFIVSVTNGSPYCSAAHSHSILATSRSLSFNDLIALAQDLDSVQLPEASRAAMKFAKKMATDPNIITDEDFAKLTDAGFEDQHIAEILSVIALAIMFNNITIAMQLPLDEGYRPVLPLPTAHVAGAQ